MEQYTGTKTIMAEPMTKTDAQVVLGRTINTTHESEDGYLVEYSDGYRSWSPKEVFDAAYHRSDTYIDRMYLEQDELAKRLDKLAAFLKSTHFSELVPDNFARFLIYMQCQLMQRYYQTLNSRIIFEESEAKQEAPCRFIGPMSFGMAIEALKNGFAIRRDGWNGKDIFVFKQVPATIHSDVIPKMTSLPAQAKQLILNSTATICYTSQCIIFNAKTGRADSWVPSISDTFADDWQIVL